MPFNSLLIKYNGFHPSRFTESYLSSMMEELQHESPQGSTLRATFSRKDKVIKGVVQISSAAGPFFAVASGAGLKEVSKKLILQMRRRLEKWKSKKWHLDKEQRALIFNLRKTTKELDNESTDYTLEQSPPHF